MANEIRINDVSLKGKEVLLIELKSGFFEIHKNVCKKTWDDAIKNDIQGTFSFEVGSGIGRRISRQEIARWKFVGFTENDK